MSRSVSIAADATRKAARLCTACESLLAERLAGHTEALSHEQGTHADPDRRRRGNRPRIALGLAEEPTGYTVDTRPGRRDGARRDLRRARWSIVLLDLKMPGMDGLQVLEQARTASPETAFVVMTAYATVDTAVAAIKLGAYDYLVKPFDPEELSLMIEKIVGQQALVRENVAAAGAS